MGDACVVGSVTEEPHCQAAAATTTRTAATGEHDSTAHNVSFVAAWPKGVPHTTAMEDLPVICVVGHRPSAPARVSVLGIILPGQPQGDIALLSRIHNLHLKVMAAGAQWVPSLSQPHIHDALALPQILQQRPTDSDVMQPAPFILVTVHHHDAVILTAQLGIEVQPYLLAQGMHTNCWEEPIWGHGHDGGAHPFPIFGEEDLGSLHIKGHRLNATADPVPRVAL